MVGDPTLADVEAWVLAVWDRQGDARMIGPYGRLWRAWVDIERGTPVLRITATTSNIPGRAPKLGACSIGQSIMGAEDRRKEAIGVAVAAVSAQAT